MRKWLLLLAVIGAVLVVDQASKQVIVTSLVVGQTRTTPLTPFFQITRSHNTGSAFGFLPQASDVFLVIAVVVVVAMLFFYPRVPAGARLTQIATGLVAGGALGNALDRIEFGHVVDFIHYQIPGLISNVSNLADHAIVFGVLLLFIGNWREERAKQATPRAEPAASSEASPPA